MGIRSRRTRSTRLFLPISSSARFCRLPPRLPDRSSSVTSRSLFFSSSRLHVLLTVLRGLSALSSGSSSFLLRSSFLLFSPSHLSPPSRTSWQRSRVSAKQGGALVAPGREQRLALSFLSAPFPPLKSQVNSSVFPLSASLTYSLFQLRQYSSSAQAPPAHSTCAPPSSSSAFSSPSRPS